VPEVRAPSDKEHIVSLPVVEAGTACCAKFFRTEFSRTLIRECIMVKIESAVAALFGLCAWQEGIVKLDRLVLSCQRT